MSENQPEGTEKAIVFSQETIGELITILKKILKAWSLIPLQNIDSIGKIHDEVAEKCEKNYGKDSEFSTLLRYLAKTPFHVAKGLHCNLIYQLESALDNYNLADTFCNHALKGFEKNKDTTYKEFISIFPIIDFLKCCNSIISILKEDSSIVLKDKKEQVEKFKNLAGWFRKLHTTLVRHNKENFNEELGNIQTLDKRMVDMYRARAQDIEVDDEQVTFMKPINSKVFIVHGHNTKILDELKDILESYSIEPVILYKESDEGRVIIEKFEHEARFSGFAFVIMTKDDLVTENKKTYYDHGSIIIEEKKVSHYQGRPNVFFELGWFCGRYGRDRVRIIKEEDVEMLSDLDGKLTANFKKNLKEKEVSGKIREDLGRIGFIIPAEENKSEEK